MGQWCRASVLGLGLLSVGLLGCGGRAVGCPALDPCGTEEPPPEAPPLEQPEAPPTAGLVTCGDPEQELLLGASEPLDVLEGCQVFLGSLRVYISPETDLSPLQSLQRIEGRLSLRGNGYYPPEHGPLASLTALRSVWALHIEGLPTEAIDFLPALERIAAPPDATGLPGVRTATLGSLTLSKMPRLRHVLGLGRATGFVSLEVNETPELTSLRGPTSASTPLVVRISEAPALRELGRAWPAEAVEELTISLSGVSDLSALGGVQRIGSLSFAGVSGLDSFEDLRSLRSIRSMRLRDTQVRSLRGLEGLREAERIVLAGNPLLEDASALESLQSLGSLEISAGNTALRSLPQFAFVEDLQSLRLRGTALEQGPVFPRVQQAQLVLIDDNQSLTAFEGLPSLQTVETLAVFNNPGLVRLSFESLSMSELLDVYCNEQLPPDSWQPLERVEAEMAQVYGNAGSERPCLSE